jgi:tetratricopeptide (TPR) repeat protein
MEKSKYVQTLDEIQAILGPFFRTNGFRKQGRSYNRLRADDIVQVINFQMGHYSIGGYEIPGIRKNLYGYFTVNLGVLLPCVDQLEFQRKAKSFYLEYDCHIRARLSELIDQDSDIWWDLNQKPEKLARSMLPLLQKVGQPFVDQFNSYQDVIAYYQDHQILPSNSVARSALVTALIYCEIDQKQTAVIYFDRALEYAIEGSSHPDFQNHIQEVRDRCL